MAAHVEQPCARCRAILAHLEQIQQILHQPKIPAQVPAREVLQRMLAVFQVERPTWSRRILAALQFDSFQQFSLAPVRGLPQSRQMLFRTLDVDIDLRVTQEDGTASIHGQVLMASDRLETAVPPSATVSLEQAGEIVACTRTDEWGQFLFPYMPAGLYDLFVTYGETQIVIENLSLEYGQ